MESITLPVAPLTALLWEEEQRLRSALITMMETHRDESEELWAGGDSGWRRMRRWRRQLESVGSLFIS